MKTLLEQAKSIVPERSGRHRTFMDKITPEQRDSLLELAEHWASGELNRDLPHESHWNAAEIYRRLIQPNGFPVAESTFRKWLAEYAQTKSLAASQESTTQGCQSGTASAVGRRRQQAGTGKRSPRR